LSIKFQLDPQIIFFVFLPPLLFHSACRIEWNVFRKLSTSIFWLSIPGALISLGISLGLFHLCFQSIPGWNFTASVILASILAATDPLALADTLSRVGAPQKLTGIIEGEALVNGGLASVLYSISSAVFLELNHSEGQEITSLAQMTLGGPVFGLCIGLVLYFLLQLAKEQTLMQISLIIISAYASYYLGEVLLGISGILAVTFLGFTVSSSSKYVLSPETQHTLNDVFAQLSYFANTLIFVLTGIIFFIDVIFHNPIISTPSVASFPESWGLLVAVYLIIHLSRCVSLLIGWPVLSCFDSRLSKKEVCFISFVGLRGSVSLALGLLLEEVVRQKVRLRSHDGEYVQESINLVNVSDTINFIVAGCVLLMFLINGNLAELLFKKLDMYPMNPYRKILFEAAMEQMEEEVLLDKLSEAHHDILYQFALWKFVEIFVPKLNMLQLVHGNVENTNPAIDPSKIFEAHFRGEFEFSVSRTNSQLDENFSTRHDFDSQVTVKNALRAMGSAPMIHEDSELSAGSSLLSIPRLSRKRLTREQKRSESRSVSPATRSEAKTKKSFNQSERDRTLSALSKSFSSRINSSPSSLDIREAEIRTSMFKRIIAEYVHQFEHHEISTFSASVLNHAAGKGSFEALYSSVELAWKVEFDDLIEQAVKLSSFVLRLAQLPILKYILFPYVFSRVLNSLEALLGYYRAHEETLHSFRLSFPDEDFDALEPFLNAAKESIKAIRHKFPQVFFVAETIFTARYIVRIKRDEVSSCLTEGFLDKQDVTASIAVLEKSLRGIESLKLSWKLARLCLDENAIKKIGTDLKVL
jgi:NhaP-type Na+/H+ or K+/H+ antiporter